MTLNSIIIADDSAGCNIADLCVSLKDSTLQLLNQYAISHPGVGLNSRECLSAHVTKQNLSEHLCQINSNNFICFWYGHGQKQSFSIGGEDIVTTRENHYIFSNALIYTFSCHNGGGLADELIRNQTKVFVGYKGKAYCPDGINDITTAIVMSFLNSFFDGKTISEAMNDLKSAYEHSIYDDTLDPFQRSYFHENRDNLVVKGNDAITIEDLLIVADQGEIE